MILQAASLYPSGRMDRLKLTALDADDLSVISAAVQDSLVAVRDCAFFAAESRFVLLLNRFRWEADATVETAYWRTHSALVFNAVRLGGRSRPSRRPTGGPIPPWFSTR